MADCALHQLPAGRTSTFRIAPLPFDLPRLDCCQASWLGSLALHAATALL